MLDLKKFVSYASQIAWFGMFLNVTLIMISVLVAINCTKLLKRKPKKSKKPTQRTSATAMKKQDEQVPLPQAQKDTSVAIVSVELPEKKNTSPKKSDDVSDDKEGENVKKEKKEKKEEEGDANGVEAKQTTQDKDEKVATEENNQLENTVRIEMSDDDHTKDVSTDMSACLDAYKESGGDNTSTANIQNNASTYAETDGAKIEKKSSKHVKANKKITSQKRKIPGMKKKKKTTTDTADDGGGGKKRDKTQESVDCGEKNENKGKKKTDTKKTSDSSEKKELSPNAKVQAKSGTKSGKEPKMKTMEEPDAGKQESKHEAPT